MQMEVIQNVTCSSSSSSGLVKVGVEEVTGEDTGKGMEEVMGAAVEVVIGR